MRSSTPLRSHANLLLVAAALLAAPLGIGCASGGGTGRDAGRRLDAELLDAPSLDDAPPAEDGSREADAWSTLDAPLGADTLPSEDAPRSPDAPPSVDAPLPLDAPALRDGGVDARIGADAPVSFDAGADAPVDRCAGVVCTGMATACLDASCDPATGACRTTPRTGVTCDDGNACTSGDRCTSSGTCAGMASASCGDGACACGETTASCPTDCGSPGLPSNACTNGSGSRDRCGGARIIGRSAAAVTGGWSSGVQNTCTASNRLEGESCPSFDVGNDHVYAIFVRAGERVTAELGATSTRCATGEEFRSYLKFKFNPDASASGATSCPTLVGCYGGPARGSSLTTTRTYDATADGWLFVAVDGGATAFDEHRGYYTLRVELSRCATTGCGC
jgi:hypothetical protein